MPCLVKAMAKLSYEEIFAHAADVLGNKPGMDNFWEEVEKIKDEAEVKRLVRIFSEVTNGIVGEAAIKLKKMLQAEQEDDWEGFSAAIKEAVSVCPKLGSILKRYTEIYAGHRMEYQENRKNYMEGRAGQETSAEKPEAKGNVGQEISAEMQILAAQIKAQIPILLSQGMKQEALQVLSQLRTFVPDDAELAELEKQIIGQGETGTW